MLYKRKSVVCNMCKNEIYYDSELHVLSCICGDTKLRGWKRFEKSNLEDFEIMSNDYVKIIPKDIEEIIRQYISRSNIDLEEKSIKRLTEYSKVPIDIFRLLISAGDIAIANDRVYDNGYVKIMLEDVEKALDLEQ